MFFFSSRVRHTRWPRDWSSDVCSSDLPSWADSSASGVPPSAPPARPQMPNCRPTTATDRPGARCMKLEIGRASCRERVEDQVRDRLAKLQIVERRQGVIDAQDTDVASE